METILIVGLGHHSRRIYYPILEKLNKYKIVVIDTIQQKEIIQEYLHNKTLKPLKEIYIDPFSEKRKFFAN